VVWRISKVWMHTCRAHHHATADTPLTIILKPFTAEWQPSAQLLTIKK